ncbi:SCP2 sterol-binding domain-containing protein [Conexibacter sp. SYSU D00693]|uniref:SCP2 sterol-binding domain-containing protein n=1 Tax=Conexibacter sp. SYSU D00693 TaxID=2812560 RepID=UPI00196AA930|nr:SCP2 sterol-binding domain-containing protein [Conexibacter sp. SYSU D00693]
MGTVHCFRSAEEVREVLDKAFTLMSEDPDVGPRLRAADVPQRFELTDVDLVVNIRPARDGEEGNLHWEWSDDVDWEPKVEMTMSSEVANRYWQGRENIAMAITRRRIKASGDLPSALALLPLTKPVFPRYRELVEADYPHLALEAVDRPR